tara:strand:- start:1168 stop:1884 length:717 start_codon:yes stop_codon:yes gene_type:complete
MPTIGVSTTSGIIRDADADFADARDGNGSIANFVDLSDTDDIIASNLSRGNQLIFRAFYAFDTSGITSTVASATLDVNINTLQDTDGSGVAGILVKGAKPDLSTNLAAADFDSTPGCTASQSGASYASTATAYSSAFTVTGTGALSITFNSTALSDMVSNSVFNIVIFEHGHDFTNNAPASGDAFNRFDVDGRTGGTPLVLNYTLATGYANNVMGVAAANVAKVNGVATANIDKINGV